VRDLRDINHFHKMAALGFAFVRVVFKSAAKNTETGCQLLFFSMLFSDRGERVPKR